jgi:hypothetical protein
MHTKLKSLLCYLTMFFAICDSLQAQWSVNWLHRFGSSKGDLIHEIIIPKNSENRYLAIGLSGASDTPGIIHKGDADGIVLDIHNGQLSQIKVFGGSDKDKLYGGIEYSENLFIFWGETASSDGDITYHPDPGNYAGWVIFTDSLLNVIKSFVIQAPNAFNTTFFDGIAISHNKFILTGAIQYQGNPTLYDSWLLVMDLSGNILYNEIESFTLNPVRYLVTGLNLFYLDSIHFAVTGKSVGTQIELENFFYIGYYDSIQNKIIKVNTIKDVDFDHPFYVAGHAVVEGEHFFIARDKNCNSDISTIRYFKLQPGDTAVHLGCQVTNAFSVFNDNPIHLYLDSRMLPMLVHSNSDAHAIIQEGDFSGNTSYEYLFDEFGTFPLGFLLNVELGTIVMGGFTTSTSGVFSGTQNHGQTDLWIAELYMPSFSLDDTHVNRSLLQVYPNPAFTSTPLQVSVPNSGVQHIQIFNLQGQNIPITYTMSEEKCILQFVSEVPPGTYLLSALDERGRRYSTQLFILPD